jgi:hypothetical protein
MVEAARLEAGAAEVVPALALVEEVVPVLLSAGLLPKRELVAAGAAVAGALLSAGLLPKRELAAAGAVVVAVPDVAVVEAGAAAVLAAGAPVAAGAAPKRLLVAGADVVAAGTDAAGLAPNRLLVAAGADAAAVVAVDDGTDEAAADPKRLLVVVLLPDAVAPKGLAAAVAGAGLAAVVGAGFAPKRLEVVAGAEVAGCEGAAEAALPKRLPDVEVGAASGFLPKRLLAPALLLFALSFAAPANSEEPLAAGAAAGAVELVLPNMPPVDGCAAGVPPKRPPGLGACVCA